MTKVWFQSRIKRSDLIASICFLLFLIMFVSKISLKWTGIVPYSLPPIIFQYGIHPYINFGLNLLGGMALFPLWFRAKGKPQFNRHYIIFLYLIIAILTIQTLFQIIFVNIEYSIFMQLSGLGMAILLILIYGIMIPTLLPIRKFATNIRNISVFLIFVSLILLPILWPHLFRGGRFIGVFKHIPHSVSASTFAFIFFAPKVFSGSKFTLRTNTILASFTLLLIAFAVFLTATKAAMVTIFIVFITALMVYGSKKASVRMFKFLFVVLASLAVLMFGIQTVEFLYEVATGQQAFLMRPAQDGIESRMDEIYRGIQMFNQSPYFGKGILYKFMTSSGVDLNNYNSFKDPHNLFISAGVVGGWPFMLLAIYGYILLIIGTFKCLRHKNKFVKVIGLFIISHLPVFIIYHVHLSMGGLADRMYWLIFGYMALNYNSKNALSD